MGMRITNHLADIRKEAGWTQGQLAAMMGCTRKTVYSWEHSDRMPRLEVALALAEGFGKPLPVIFEPFAEQE